MRFPAEFKYTKDHEYINVDGNEGIVGLSDYAQDQLGDIVFVELPEVGQELAQGDVFAVVESVKAVSDSYCPAGGTVIKINERLLDEPELINQDPHGEGWIMVIELSEPADLDNLMDLETYEKHVEEAGH